MAYGERFAIATMPGSRSHPVIASWFLYDIDCAHVQNAI